MNVDVSASESVCNRQGELFADLPVVVTDHYPLVPGFKVTGTSKDAAEQIKLSASKIRALALAEFRFAYPAGLSADQVARNLGRSVLYIRPRCSELRARGLIEPTNETIKNPDSGMAAKKWRATALSMEKCEHD